MVRKRAQLYLGWRWRQASGAVASRCSGESALCRQDRNGDEDDQGRRGAPGPFRQVLLCKRRKTSLKVENFGRTSPARGGFQNLQEKPSARWPTSTFGARWPTQPQTWHKGRQRHKRRDGRQPCGFTFSSGEGGDDGVDDMDERRGRRG